MRDGRSVHPVSSYLYRDEFHYIAAGSLGGSLLMPDSPVGEWKWVVCGIGIHPAFGNYPAFFTSDEWNSLLQKPKPDIHTLDGHFIAVRWKSDCIEIFTDQCGLRELYFTKTDSAIIFSSQPYWISRIIGDRGIDFHAFGSRWLCINQLSHRSIFADMTRVASGGFVRIERRDLIIRTSAWTPPLNEYIPPETVIEKIKRYVLFPSRIQKRINLSLSGGLDSRVILSLLLSEPGVSFQAHSFGERDHPDVITALEICNDLQVPFEIFDGAIPDQNDCIRLLKEFAGFTQCTNPISTALNLRYYPKLSVENNIVIDGGFGEIWRREFLNSILIRGEKYIHEKDVGNLARLFTHKRADIFNEDTMREMRAGVLEDLENICIDLPDAVAFGNANWLDLLAIRMRLVNFYGPEQNRVDQYVNHFMPYAQPSLLSDVFRLPLRYRRNGYLLHRIIGQYQTKLSKYPLIKGGTTYPYRLSTFQSRIWTSIKRKSGKSYRSGTQVSLLHLLKEFVIDTLASEYFLSYPYYDHRNIRHKVDTFYSGDERYAGELDWWLSFELMRTGYRA
jgi:hypothetical protein